MTESTYDPIAELHRLRTILVDDHDVPVEHDGVLKGWRRERPLLTQLRAAAGSNIGATQGGGSAANTKVPINVGALDLYDRIRYESGDMHYSPTGTSPNGCCYSRAGGGSRSQPRLRRVLRSHEYVDGSAASTTCSTPHTGTPSPDHAQTAAP
jgi:hypothetical protein